MTGLDSYYTVLAQVVTFVAVSEPSWWPVVAVYNTSTKVTGLDSYYTVLAQVVTFVAVYYTSTEVAGLDSYYTVLAQVVTFVAVSELSWRLVVLLYITLVLRCLVWIVIILC